MDINEHGELVNPEQEAITAKFVEALGDYMVFHNTQNLKLVVYLCDECGEAHMVTQGLPKPVAEFEADLMRLSNEINAPIHPEDLSDNE